MRIWARLDPHIERHEQYMCCTGGIVLSGNARVAFVLMQSRARRGGYRLLQMDVGSSGERVTDLPYPELRFVATSSDGAMATAAASSGMVVIVSPAGKRLIHTNSWAYGDGLWDVDVNRWRDLDVQIAGRELTRAERQIHIATR